MSNAEFGWQSLLHTDSPPVCPLIRALFTTYNRADERLLAEHLLPLLLKLDHEPESEGAERQYFLLQLDERLKQLHDRLVIVSSTACEEPGDADEGGSVAYGWIWRSIRRLIVGRRGKAVQHAKLWLLHWGADGNSVEHLEIVISSANLTHAAFKGQLQAAWRAYIKLQPRSDARLAGWSVLPAFLRGLASHAGDDERLGPFVELLARADCPEGVTFVASIPGTHSPQDLHRTPWGAAGLQQITPPGQGRVRAEILTPFVGTWEADALNRWCARFEGSPDRLALVWIDKVHPWAKNWILPEATLKTLIGAGANLRQLRHTSDDGKNPGPFHSEHRSADERWGHAKVYSFQRGPSRRLLVTSANFSPAAWGRQNDDGELTIENFELGVCVKQAAWPFDNLEPFDKTSDAATVTELPARGAALITWARAGWDGNKVDVHCRCQAGRELVGELQDGGDWTPITLWTVDADGWLRLAQVPWTDAKQQPSFVRLTCEQEPMSVPVFDERPWQERKESLPLGVSEDTAQRMRDDLLFEQYGGRVAEDEGEELGGCVEELVEENEEDGPGISEDYAVPAFVHARRYLGVVDNWAARRATGELERQWLQRDGELLVEAFQRRAERDGKKEPAWAIGSKLAAEELKLRLNHFREL
jgi:hypothetical protein